MPQQPTGPGNSGGTPPGPDGPAGPSPASGGVALAGALMVISGVLGVLNGIAGIATDDVYNRVDDYVFAFSLVSWGWTHVVVGVVVAVTGWGLLRGAGPARAVGVFLAGLYVVEHFVFLPYAPVWSVISIAIGVFVLWALLTAKDTYATT